MGLSYVWEKLQVAVDCLATGHNSLQERLAEAGISSLVRLKVTDFPEELQEDWNFIWNSLTEKEPAGNEGSIRASTKVMPDQIAEEVASTITSLHYKIIKEATRQNPDW